MSAKSTNLFGTFLETVSGKPLGVGVSTGVAGAAGAAQGAVVGGAQGGTRLGASEVGEMVLKVLAEHIDRPVEIGTLIQMIGCGYSAVVSAVDQLQSYGLVVNESGRITLSPQGVEVAAQSK